MPSGRGVGLGRKAAGAAVLLGVMAGAGDARGQIVLDGPNLDGRIGLGQEVFASAYVSASWSGGNISIQLVNGDSTFSARVGTDALLSFSVNYSGLQAGTNASLWQGFYSIPGPSSSATAPLAIDLSRNAGRIVGDVQVAAGTLVRVEMSASASATNEYASGSAVSQVSPFQPVLPFPAYSTVTVQGTAILRAAAGCDVPVTLASRTVTVPAGSVATPTWSFDLSAEACNQGGMQGQITWTGLGTIPARYIALSGPGGYRSQSTGANGAYSFSGLAPGDYYTWDWASFAAPFGSFNAASTAVRINAGEVLTKNIARDFAAIHGVIEPRGAWTLADTSSTWSYLEVRAGSQYLGSSYDSLSRPGGHADWILPAGSVGAVQQIGYSFYRSDASRYTSQTLYQFFQTSSAPFSASPAAGVTADVGTYQPETSESLVVVQPANAAVGLTRLTLNGSQTLYEAGAYKGSRQNLPHARIVQQRHSSQQRGRAGARPARDVRDDGHRRRHRRRDLLEVVRAGPRRPQQHADRQRHRQPDQHQR